MGKMGSDLMDISKKIAVIRQVGIRKTNLISSPIQKEGDVSLESQDVLDNDEFSDTEENVEDSVTVDTSTSENVEDSVTVDTSTSENI